MSNAMITESWLKRPAVLELQLTWPPGNILSIAMISELQDRLESHRGDRHLKLIVLRGAGSHFSYGASIPEHRPESAAEMLRVFHGFLRRLVTFPTPTAAVVEGNCLGGGFELVLCCHFIFASSGAHFGCPEIKLGVFPPVLAAIGDRRLGSRAAERLLLTGETIDAQQASDLGLLTTAPSVEKPAIQQLDQWFEQHLAPLSAMALRQATRAVRGWRLDFQASIDRAEQQYLEELLATEDAHEGVEAFLAKRAPEWRDA